VRAKPRVIQLFWRKNPGNRPNTKVSKFCLYLCEENEERKLLEMREMSLDLLFKYLFIMDFCSDLLCFNLSKENSDAGCESVCMFPN